MSSESMVNAYLLNDMHPEALLALQGKSVQAPLPQYILEATPDNIRHWAYGTGDRNPLWLDWRIAKASRWETVLAPPAMLFSFSRLSSGYLGGVPGLDSVLKRIDCRFHRPIVAGERITSKAVLRQVSGDATGVSCTLAVTFHDGDGAEVGGFQPTTLFPARPANHSSIEPARWTSESLEEFFAAYEAEAVADRSWESVSLGEELPGILRGPTTTTTAIAFARSFGGQSTLAHSAWYHHLAGMPTIGEGNSYGVPEPLERVRWDADFARQHGLPAPIDEGPERVSWLANLVTNWLGAGGTLRRLTVEILRPAFLGDATRLSGRVVGKREEEGERLAELSLQAVDQRGDVTARGTAVAAFAG